MNTKKKEPGLLSLVVVLTVICLVMAALLGMVDKVTAPAIAANTEKTVVESLQKVLPADSYDDLYPEEKGGYTGSVNYVTTVYQAGDKGYVVRVSPTSGFSGAIDMMAGFDNDGLVTGISIISHSETSGLGANATKPEWQEQFKGLEGEATVEKDGGQIVALTGSTITSRAVCDGVNAARAAVEELG